MTRSNVLLTLAACLPLALGSVTVSAQKPGDGIKVHGHWTVDVRNPDGTLASHNEFENALTTGGSDRGTAALARLLGGGASVQTWALEFFGVNFQGQCMAAFGPTICRMVPIGTPIPPGNEDFQFPTLAVAQVASQPGGPLDSVELTGNITASFAFPIVDVVSIANLTTGAHIFSSRTLATPIQVAVGQKIYVKVVFSFS